MEGRSSVFGLPSICGLEAPIKLTTQLMLYGLGTLVAAILVWLNVFSYADVIRVGNKEELIGG